MCSVKRLHVICLENNQENFFETIPKHLLTIKNQFYENFADALND